MPSILFIYTSVEKTPNGNVAGWFLPEAAHPYWILAADPSITIDFASPKGANPPVAPGSVESYAQDAECVKFLNDETVKSKLANAKKLSDVSASDYDAIFYIGGHGPVFDLPEDSDNVKLATDIYNAGKIVSAVCHGTAAVANIKTSDGKSIFAGRRFTGFSTAEEKTFGTENSIPFLLEEKIVALGGIYSKAAEPFGAHIVVDGKLLTGQNPASAVPLGNALLKALLAA